MCSHPTPNPIYNSPLASTPPAPPPKAPHNPSGPPLPPLPHSSTPQAQSYAQAPPPQSHPQPPEPGEGWLPEVLPDKTYHPTPPPSCHANNAPSRTAQLTPLLTHPSLLTSLSTTHPAIRPSPLPAHLTPLAHLATHVQSTHTHLLSLRARTQEHLLHLHALERQWRAKQAQMDKGLEAWSAKSLYQRLGKGEREGEAVSKAVEESWLDGEGGVGEREVGDVVRRFREGRERVGRRREGRERWDEGRVGGWR